MNTADTVAGAIRFSDSDEGFLQDDLVDLLSRSIKITDTLFTMLDKDRNGAVELADLHRMQVQYSSVALLLSCLSDSHTHASDAWSTEVVQVHAAA